MVKNVGLVSLRTSYIDSRYPISLGHFDVLSRTKQALNLRLIINYFYPQLPDRVQSKLDDLGPQ
jgi:hypothetical protein